MHRKFFLIIFISSYLSAAFNFNSRSSAIVVKSGSTFNITNTLNNFDGSLIKENGGTIQGAFIAFDCGILEDQGNELKLTATFDPLGTISLLGSDTFRGNGGTVLQAISVQSSNNRIEGNPVFNNDITLVDFNSTLTLALDNTLNTTIILNDSTIRLDNDLKFADGATISGSGTINVNSNRLEFGAEDLTFSDSLIWENASDISLTGNITVATSFTLNGANIVNGNGNTVNITGNGGIFVGSGGDLTLKNLLITGVAGGNIACIDDSSTIVYENANIAVSNPYTFDTGTITFQGDNSITGSNKFIYSATFGSTIDSNAQLTIDSGVTFSYDPPVASNNLINFSDITSMLKLKSCTLHATSTGLTLANGTLVLEGAPVFTNDGGSLPEGISFGDGANDLDVEFFPGVPLEISSGFLDIKNVN